MLWQNLQLVIPRYRSIQTEICAKLLESSGSDNVTETRKTCNWSYLLQTNIIPTGNVETVRKTTSEKTKTIIEEKQIIPKHQFGFRHKHSTIDQVHRITTIIERALEEQQVCSTLFLDVAQVFDTVWHEGLFYKLELLLPTEYSQILKSYLSERYFASNRKMSTLDSNPLRPMCHREVC
jgi:hypothetical protein